MRNADEFNFFAQLERMGDTSKILEFHEIPLFFASMGPKSPFENAVSALHLQDMNELVWRNVTTYVIEEYKLVAIKPSKSCQNDNATKRQVLAASKRKDCKCD